MNNNSNVWDIPGQGFRSGLQPSGTTNPSFTRTFPYGSSSVVNTPLGRVTVAPPVPPRPVTSSFNSYSSYGSNFTNYGLGGFPNYGFSGYGSGYGYGFGYRPYNSYGYGRDAGYFGGNNPESRFIQLAEESSRPAFQSIQSVLQAFSSVAMMFDSTFNALYSSYMSVIGVADNFGKLRAVFGQMFSAVAFFRLIYWAYRRILYKLGISEINPDIESIWVNCTKGENASNEIQSQNPQKPLSTIIFLSVIMAGPYLLFKLMNHIYPNPKLVSWDPVKNPGSLALGMYDFQSTNIQELSFSANQKLMIAPKNFQPSDCPGWLLACNENKKIGLIPNNYIGMVMKSETTGNTYVDHNGQKFYPKNPTESVDAKFLDSSVKRTEISASEKFEDRADN